MYTLFRIYVQLGKVKIERAGEREIGRDGRWKMADNRWKPEVSRHYESWHVELWIVIIRVGVDEHCTMRMDVINARSEETEWVGKSM